MPSSCESDQSSSPSLISSLRSFRFQSKNKPYVPASPSPLHPVSPRTNSAIGIVPETPDSQKPGNLLSSPGSTGSESKVKRKTRVKSSLSSTPLSSASSSPSGTKSSQSATSASSSPASSVANRPQNKAHLSTEKFLHFIQRIKSKFGEALKNTSSDTVNLKLSSEDIQRFKIELTCLHTEIIQRWENNVTEESVDADDNSPSEITLKFNRQYLDELLSNTFKRRGVAVKPSESSPSPTVKKSNLSNSIRTYTRAAKDEHVPSDSDKNLSSGSVLDSNKLDTISEGQKQLAMDDYEVFCEKETNLRHLLDAFPGADIMEAQDILVKCKWDLKHAIQVAHQKPLRTTRKRGLPQETLDAKRTANENEKADSNNLPVSRHGPSPSTSTKTSEEIVLDSSDEDTNERIVNNRLSKNNVDKSNATSNQPPAKKSKRVIASSSSSEEEGLLLTSSHSSLPGVKMLSLANDKEATIPKQPTAKTLQNQNKDQVVKPSTTQSMTIQNVNINRPTPTQAVSITQDVKSTTQTISIQNVKSTVQAINIPSVKSITHAVSIQNVKSTPLQQASVSKDQDKVSTANEQTAKAQSMPISNSSQSMSMESIPNLPKGLVITQIQARVQTQAGNQDSNASLLENSNVMSLSKSISLTPVSNSISLTPASSSVSITPTKVNSNINLASTNSMTIKQTGNSISIIPTGGSVSIQPLNDAKESSKKDASKLKSRSKAKKYDEEEEDDEEYGNDDIYDSEDSDCDETLTAAHSAVLSFFQDATGEELGTIAGCSKKKVDAVMAVRPFKGWTDLVDKLKNDKVLSPDLLNGAKKVIDMRNAISRLMAKCQQISLDMEDLVEDLKENKETSTDYVGTQPDLLNDKMHLTAYQMLGLNWLLLMHNQEVNGILADEMGLGKTVQAIAFLAYLKQVSISGPHLIVVPSSTLDNWKKELEVWWPQVSVICYHGSQDSRRELRMQILNDEVDEFDVMVTTYNMVTSSVEDRNFFKRLEFHYVIFDEAHMLKNMASQRYQNLMRIKAPRRLLLTGTPLQNNLVELMSLLIFAMPHMFSGKIEQIKQMFSSVGKSEDGKSSFERDRVEHAKRIMKPFVLRRLKCDVLKELPAKHEETRLCPLSEDQSQKYHELVKTFSEEVRNQQEKDVTSSGAGMMMQLRRAANHPLLLRRHFDDDKLLKMSKAMLKEPTHSQNDPNLIFEDMCVMSDFELHKLCKSFKTLKQYVLTDDLILDSGKFKVLDTMMPKLIEEDHRILLFSQFTMVLDVVQEYMDIKDYKYLRLDGQVPVTERQTLIDEFNTNPEIPVFLLSTRAGGLGINLTAADTVILHDIDFNPYNDKQAEDRCHRVGQIRDVKVFRFISEDTIEEGILQRAKEKLKLERDIHAENETEENDVVSVAKLLRDALGLKTTKS